MQGEQQEQGDFLALHFQHILRVKDGQRNDETRQEGEKRKKRKK